MTNPERTPTVLLAAVEPIRQSDGANDALRRVERGFASADDLLHLSGFLAGRDALKDIPDVVWPQLRCLAVLHPELIPPFFEWFRNADRLRPYLHAAFEAVADEDIACWNKYWAVIATSQSPADRAEFFLELLRCHRRDLQSLTRPGRRALRHEATRCFADATPEVVPLLYPTDAVECREILRDELLPVKWRAFSLAATLKSSKTRTVHPEIDAEAHVFLAGASPDLVREYLLRAQHVSAEHPELWNAVLDSPHDRGDLLERLLELGTAIPGPRWHPLLDSLGAFRRESAALTPDRLGRTLAIVGADPTAWPIWQGALARLDLRFLKGDFTQTEDWSTLDRARKARPDLSLPLEITARLDAGLLLKGWVTQPHGMPAADLHTAFAALNCPVPTALRAMFHFFYGAPTVGRDLAAVDRFAEIFRTLYPVSSDPRAAAAWQTLAGTVPAPQRESLLGYYWTRMSPATPVETPQDRDAIPASQTPELARVWRIEALIYSGIIGAVFLLIGVLLLLW